MEDILHHLECINLVNNGINCLPTGAGFLQQYPFIWVLPIFQWIPWGLIFRPFVKISDDSPPKPTTRVPFKNLHHGKMSIFKKPKVMEFFFFRCFSFWIAVIFPSPKNSAILGIIDQPEVPLPSMPQLEALAVARCGFPTWRYQRPRPSSCGEPLGCWVVVVGVVFTNLW